MKNNILIIKHGALGDVILAGAALQAIREKHLGDNLICLTGKLYFEILKNSPWVDEVIIDIKPRWYDLNGWLKLLNIFRSKNFIKVYDLQTSYRSNIYFYMFCYLKKVPWSGIAYGSRFRHSNVNRKKMHTYDRLKDQLKLCGINYNYLPNWNWLLKKYKNEKLIPKTKFAIIVPGAAAHRFNKRWSKISYANLINMLSERGIISLILGTILEKKYVNDIIDLVDQPKALMPINYTGKTNFKDIVYLSSYACFAIGNDTGPMHLIASTSLLTIVLFGPASNPDLCAPVGDNVKIIQEANINDIKVDEILSCLQ